MRRVMLLALLALALSTAALAQTVPFSFSTGAANNLEMGTVTGSPTISDPTSLDASVTGNGITVDFATTNLLCPSGGLGSCTFNTANVTVEDSSGTTLFSDSLMGGSDIRSFDSSDGTNNDVINADLVSGLGTVNGVRMSIIGGAFGMGAVYTDNGNATLMRSDVSGSAVIPEPGTLAMLGTGLIGLGGMARRKFKRGK